VGTGVTLPAGSRRVWLLAIREMPVTPTVTDPEGRPTRAEHIVAAWHGDLQSVRSRGGEGQVVQPNSGGPVIATHLAFADVLDIAEADAIATGRLTGAIGATVEDLVSAGAVTFDDELRYQVDRVARPGPNSRLDHLEVYCHLVTSAIP
jgi:hypothetical protein